VESEQIQAEAAPPPPPPAEPDFARIAQEAPQPTLAERLGMPALAWGGALIAVALLSLGALWLRNERDVNQAMEVVAGSTRADAPAPSTPPAVAAAPAASSLPPLVMLPAPQQAKAVAPAATETPVKPLAKVQPASRVAQPTLAAKAPRPAAKPQRADTRLAARQARKPAPAVVVHDRPITRANLNIAVAQRCKTGDLARECLASLCRQGKKGDAACQALSNLDH
jgi:hypothetical protein